MAQHPPHLNFADGATALAARLNGMGNGFGRIVTVFHEIVGPQLSRVATPSALRSGTLTIRCSSASWAQSINMRELELIDRLTERLGPGVVTRIHARAGGPAPQLARTTPPQLEELEPATAQRLEQLVASIADPQLRDQVLAAATAAARRAAQSGKSPS